MDLIETMLVTDGNINNFSFHLERIKKTYNHFRWSLNPEEWLNLNEKFTFKQKPLRVRVTYNSKGIKEIELFEIKKRNFKNFKTVEIDFDYSFKYKKRAHFEKLKKKYPEFEEFILIKNSLVTDTSISNLAFFTGSEWLSPKHPLLYGTKREELLKKGLIKEAYIHKSDLKHFKKWLF